MESEMLRKPPVSLDMANDAKVNRTVFAKMFKMPLPPDIDYLEHPDFDMPEAQKQHLQKRFGAPGTGQFGPPLPSSTFYQVRLEAVQPS